MNLFQRIFRKSKTNIEELSIALALNDNDKQLINEFSILDDDNDNALR